jgi:metacaspase-1
MSNKRIAMFVALNNYPGTINDLRGCVNDYAGWKKHIDGRFPVDEQFALIDKNATVENFKKTFESAYGSCKENDSLFLFYSGHGTNVKDLNKDEIDGRDEAICLYDGNVIDDYFAGLFKTCPAGLNLVVFFDSCFSGTATRLMQDASMYRKSRYMPPPDTEFAARSDSIPVASKIFKSAIDQENMNEVLFSGCNDKQTSADAFVDGQYNGAFSWACFKALDNCKFKMTYQMFYNRIRKILPSDDFDQIPQIEGSRKNKAKLIFS